MIHLDSIYKSYRTRAGFYPVLKGLNLTIAPGEKIGILGRNGAGKSTLIRLISGAELPDRGHVRRGMSVSWPLAFGGGFQGGLTGLDNVRFVCRVYGADPRRVLPFVEEFAELGEFLREPVKNYSAGMRARLAFSMSMAIDFDCFLIDEVISVGDARFHAKCRQELFEKRRDRAMVIVSHEVHNIRANCDRACVLADGVLVGFDDIDAAYEFYNAGTGLGAPAGARALPPAAGGNEMLAGLRPVALSVVESLADGGRHIPPAAMPLIRHARSVDELLRTTASLMDQHEVQALAYARRIPDVKFSPPRQRPAWYGEPVCVIFLHSEAWLPFVMAVSDAMREREGIRSVLVYDAWFPALGQPHLLGDSVRGVMALAELEGLPGDRLFPVDWVVTHSFAWQEQASVLLELFPEARLAVYADGFRGDLSDLLAARRAILAGFSFGPSPVVRDFPQPVILPERVVVHAERVVSVYETGHVPPLPEHALVHLRAWPQIPPGVDTAPLIDALVATIVRASAGLPVVLRMDATGARTFRDEVRAGLEAQGVDVCTLEQALEIAGGTPMPARLSFEQQLALGMARRASVHVLFEVGPALALAVRQPQGRVVRLALGVMVPAGILPVDSPLLPHFRFLHALAARQRKALQELRPDCILCDQSGEDFFLLALPQQVAGHVDDQDDAKEGAQ